MKKTIFFFALSFILLTNSINVYAQDVTNTEAKVDFQIDDSFISLLRTNPERIYREYENVIDIQEVQLSENQIEKTARAFECTSEGKINELDCIVTLSKIVCRNNINSFLFSTKNSTYNYYILTAETAVTESTDSLEKDGVKLYGTIAWYDNFGIINEFDHVSGVRGGAITGDGYYVAQRSSGVLCSGHFSGSGFTGRSSLEDKTGYSFSLLIRTSASNGSTVQLNFSTSIFD